MRISDWSSDVCSSDLAARRVMQFHAARDGLGPGLALLAACDHLLGALDVDACLRIVKRCTQQLPERRGFAIVVDRGVVRGIASPLVLNQARALEASTAGRSSALRQIRYLGQPRAPGFHTFQQNPEARCDGAVWVSTVRDRRWPEN